MSQFNVTDSKTYRADVPTKQYLRLKRTATGVDIAGATDKDIGVANREAFEAGEDIPVHLRTAQGSMTMVSAGAIAAGAEVFAAADGKVSAAGTVSVGTADHAVGAADEYVEVIRN